MVRLCQCGADVNSLIGGDPMRLAMSSLLAASLLVWAPPTASPQSSLDKNVIVGMYSGLALVMNVHHPESPNGYGIIVIHGSGWGRPLAYDAPMLSERVGIAGPLVEAGYTVFVLNHRATPRFQFPAPLEDVQRAVRFIRYHAADYDIDPVRIGAFGESSGGHLSHLLGTMDGHGDPDDPDPVSRASAKVQTVVAWSAPVDLTRRAGAARTLLIGAELRSRPPPAELRLYQDASPINYVTPDDPPTLLVHGDADEVVLMEQSVLMRDALESVGVPSRFLQVPGGGHGPALGDASDPPDYVAATIAWFQQYLGGE